MNFYERAAKLIEVRSPHSSRPHKPQSGSRSRPTGRGPMTDAERKKDRETSDAATATVLKKSAEIAAKKNGDVDEWGSGQAVAQKDKRQADRKKEIGQKSVPHKYGRSQKVSPTHPHTSDLHKAGEKKKAEGGDSVNASKKTKKKINADVKSGSGDLPGRDSTGAVVGGKPQMTNKEETPEQTKARKERAANADKVNKANMQPLPDDKPINASKKTKKKVKVKESMDIEQFFGSIYGTISEEQLNEMAMNATKKGKKKKKKINDEDDDQIERDQADREEDDAKAEDEEEAETGQAVEANTRGSNVDLGDPKNKKHADAKAKAGELAKKAETGQTTTDTGWRDKATGKPTFAPKGTSSLNAAKKGKLKKKVVSAMKEGEDKDWIQKAVDPDHEGYCTPMTKDTCTPKRKALAKTFKKMGRKRDRETKAKDEK